MSAVAWVHDLPSSLHAQCQPCHCTYPLLCVCGFLCSHPGVDPAAGTDLLTDHGTTQHVTKRASRSTKGQARRRHTGFSSYPEPDGSEATDVEMQGTSPYYPSTNTSPLAFPGSVLPYATASSSRCVAVRAAEVLNTQRCTCCVCVVYGRLHTAFSCGCLTRDRHCMPHGTNLLTRMCCLVPLQLWRFQQ